MKLIDPFQMLVGEHDVIKKGLDVLEALSKSERNKVSQRDIQNLLEFFSGFADKCHHAKEEDLLFPLAEKRGIPGEGGPIGVMLFEHDELRKMRKSMLDASKDLDKNFGKFRKNANDFVTTLRQHIDKEDNCLYPMTDSALSERDKKRLVEDFEKVEEKMEKDIHEKYERLLETLSKKYSA